MRMRTSPKKHWENVFITKGFKAAVCNLFLGWRRPNSHRKVCYRSVILIESKSKKWLICSTVLYVRYFCAPSMKHSVSYSIFKQLKILGISQRFRWYNDSLHYSCLFCHTNWNYQQLSYSWNVLITFTKMLCTTFVTSTTERSSNVLIRVLGHVTTQWFFRRKPKLVLWKFPRRFVRSRQTFSEHKNCPFVVNIPRTHLICFQKHS